MSDKKHGSGSGDNPSGQPSSRDTTTPKRARARRLVLKSIVTGGAATTIKTLPDKWTQPVTESVLLPAHAQVSGAALACRLESLLLDYTLEDDGMDTNYDSGSDLNYSSGPPFSGGAPTVTIDRFFDGFPGDALSVNIALNNVSAALDPASAGNVTLTLTPGGDFDLSTPGPFVVPPNGSGVANFSGINGNLGPANTDDADSADHTSQGNLELTFSAPGANDCTISFSFVENSFPAVF
jgi:hypothetical protein